MDQSIKVSVVIPVYNTENYILQTIESVGNQTLREIEIIAVNDGSTDGSLGLMEKAAAADSRIRVFSQPNMGVSVARNRGIAEARGEYIYFIDSDDILKKDTLKSCYDKCRDLDLDIVIFDAEIFRDIKGFETHYLRCSALEDKVYTGVELMEALMASGGYRASVCLIMSRTEYVRGLGVKFHPGILHEDELFTPQLLLPAGRAGRIDSAFYLRRMRAGSIMNTSFTQRNIDGYKTVVDGLKTYAKGRPERERKVLMGISHTILNGILWNVRAMPFPNRVSLVKWSLCRHMGMVRVKSVLRLALPRRSGKK